MADRIIQTADLRAIENGLGVINDNLSTIDVHVDVVNQNVNEVEDRIGRLSREFHDFVNAQMMQNRLQVAHTELIKVRQELDMKYGNYNEVRKHATGILQADDLGIVRRDIINQATEELMIATPNYWLTPCLIALAAWIDDNQDLSTRALKEGIHRNDEKSSLFFALVCQRAGRSVACLRWTERYLETQDEEDLDRKTIIVLDAYASGLLGPDSEGLVSKQMNRWLEKLSEKPGFVEQQKDQWSNAIASKRKNMNEREYTYLPKYSHTWKQLRKVMEGAELHQTMMDYFTNIFEQEASTRTLKEQLDDILDSLVTDFDDEELPLRKKETFEQFVVDFNGDESKAQEKMKQEELAFETHKDFTQLLTDAAMRPESSNSSVSTQKFAIALSKDWIDDAYSDLTAKNRMEVPHEIEINVGSYNGKTTDGQNEQQVLKEYEDVIENEKNAELAKNVVTAFDQYMRIGGFAIIVIGALMAIMGSPFLGIIAVIAGGAMVFSYMAKEKRVAQNRENIINMYNNRLKEGTGIIRGMMAEVVDFRHEFEEKDQKAADVHQFLNQISPEQYVRQLAGSTRRIKVGN